MKEYKLPVLEICYNSNLLKMISSLLVSGLLPGIVTQSLFFLEK